MMIGWFCRVLGCRWALVAMTLLFIGAVDYGQADEYPTKTITIVVPFPAGGTADAQARLIAKGLSSRLGKPVIVDNRAGAGGRIGTDVAARAVPDGHTLLMGSISPLAIEPVLHLSSNYDPQRDFAPLTLISEMPFVLVAGPTVQAKNLSEFIEYGRKTNNLTYASWGLGSSGHLAAELFKKSTGVNMLHVPYKGAVAAITDMVGGQVSAMFGLPIDMIGQVKAGRLRAYAVTGKKRLKMLPDVPTFVESGVADVDLRVWFGFVVPSKTPSEVRARLQSELVTVVKSPEFSDWAENQGVVVVASSPDVLAERIRSDSALASRIAKSISLKLDD